MKKRCVLGLLVTNRVVNVPDVQKVLTEYGCNIKTRIGLHDADGNVCSTEGLILLELIGDDKIYSEIENKLIKINGLQVKKMVFES
jgi:hypothetical protein